MYERIISSNCWYVSASKEHQQSTKVRPESIYILTKKKCSLEWMSFKNDNRSKEAVSKSVWTASGRLGVLIPLSLIWRRHHDRWSAANFDLCSALIAIERWGFFSIPHLLWHGASVYNGHLRGPVTLTPFAELLAVELPLPVFTTKVCHC